MAPPLTFNVELAAQLDSQLLNRQLKQIENDLKRLEGRGIKIDAGTANQIRALRRSGEALTATGKRFDEIRKASNNAQQDVQRGLRRTTSFTEQLGEKTRDTAARFGAYFAASRIISGLTQNLREAFQNAVAFDRELVKVAQLSNTNIVSARKLGSEIGRLSGKFGASSDELVKASQVFLQAGKNLTETQTLLRALAPTALTATFPDLEKTAESILALNRQFRLTGNNATEVFGSFNTIAKEANVSVAELFDGLRRGGTAFAALSGATERGLGDRNNLRNLQEFAAIFSSIIETTRESAATTGTAIRTILPRLSRTDTVDLLRQYNIDITEVRNGTERLVGAFEALRRIQEGLNRQGITPDTTAFARIVEQVGGLRQFARVAAFLTSAGRATDLLAISQQNQNSVNRDAELAAENLTVKIDKLRESTAALFRELINSKGFDALADSFINAANAGVTLLNALEPVIPLLVTLGALRTIPFLASFGRGFRGSVGVPVGRNTGGRNRDMTSALVTKGEVFVDERVLGRYGGASKVLGYNRLNTGGAISGAKKVAPGVHLFTRGLSANVDSVPTELPPGVVIRRSGAGRFLSENLNKGGRVGRIRAQQGIDARFITNLSSKNADLARVARETVQTLTNRGEELGSSLKLVASTIRKSGNDLQAIQRLIATQAKTLKSSTSAARALRDPGSPGSLKTIASGIIRTGIDPSTRRIVPSIGGGTTAGSLGGALVLAGVTPQNTTGRSFTNRTTGIPVGSPRGPGTGFTLVGSPRSGRTIGLRERIDQLQGGPRQDPSLRRANEALTVLTKEYGDTIKSVTTETQRITNRTLEGIRNPAGPPPRGPGPIRRGFGRLRRAGQRLIPSSLGNLPQFGERGQFAAAGAAAAGAFLTTSEDDRVRTFGSVLGGAGAGGLTAGIPGAVIGGIAGLVGGVKSLQDEAQRDSIDQLNLKLQDVNQKILTLGSTSTDTVKKLSELRQGVSGDIGDANRRIQRQRSNSQFSLLSASNYLLAPPIPVVGDRVRNLVNDRIGGLGLNEQQQRAFSRASFGQQFTGLFSIEARRNIANEQRGNLFREQQEATQSQFDSISGNFENALKQALRETNPSTPAEASRIAANIARRTFTQDDLEFLGSRSPLSLRQGISLEGAGERVLEDLIKSLSETANTAVLAERAQEAAARRLRAFADAVSVSTTRLEGLQFKADLAADAFDNAGRGQPGRLRGFTNLRGRSTDEVNRTINAVGRSGILGAQFQRLNPLVRANTAFQTEFAGFVNQRGVRRDDNIRTIFQDFIKSQGITGQASTVINDFLDQTKDVNVTRELGTTSLLEFNKELNTAVKAFAKTDEVANATGVFTSAVQQLNQESQRLTEKFRQLNANIIDLDRAQLQQTQRVFEQQRQRQIFLRQGPAAGTTAAIGQAIAFQNAQTATLTGGRNIGSGAIANRIVGLRNRLDAGGLTPEQIGAANLEVDRLTEALNRNANQTLALAEVNKQIASIEQARQGSRSFLERIATGGPREAGNITRELENFRRLRRGQFVAPGDVGAAITTARGFAQTRDADQIQSRTSARVLGGAVRSFEDFENVVNRIFGGLAGRVSANRETFGLIGNITGNAQTGPGNAQEVQALERRAQLQNEENAAREQQLQLQRDLIDRQIQAAEILANSQIQVAFTQPLRITGEQGFIQSIAAEVAGRIGRQVTSVLPGQVTDPNRGIV